MKRINLVILILLVAGAALFVSWWMRHTTGDRDNSASMPVFKVVAVIPLTGPGASLGEYMKNGIDLGKDAIDEQFQGKLKLQVEFIDSKNNPAEAISALQSKIAYDRPHAVIAGLSSVSSAVKPLVEREKILTAATATASENILDGSQNIFRVYPTSRNFVEPIAGYVADKYKRVATLYIHDDFGASNYRIFRELLNKKGVTIVAEDTYELLQADTRSLVAKIAAAKPEAIYIIGYGPTYTKLFKQFKEQAPEIKIVADIALPNPAVLAALGNDVEGIVFDGTDAELSNPTTAVAAEFRKKYLERYKQEPFMVAGFAYDALMMLTRAGIASGRFTAPSRKSVVALSPFDGIMGKITLDEKGENDIPLRLMQRREGQTVLFLENEAVKK